MRIEQLAPLPRRRLDNTLDEYPNAEQYFWVQEEPANQGAWPTFGLTLPELLPDKLTGIKRISRRAMSAPSSGSSKVHAVEQQEIIDEAFGSVAPTGRAAIRSRQRDRAGGFRCRSSSSGIGIWPLASDATAPGQNSEIASPVNMVAGPSGLPMASETSAAMSASCCPGLGQHRADLLAD